MLLVDACETINESMVQLIFQVSIILASNLDPTGISQPITTLQYLVLVKTFIMASKGPAEDFLAAKMRRLKHDHKDQDDQGGKAARHEPDPNQSFNQCHCIKTEVEYYHEMGIGKKLRMIGKFFWN